jgi:hypothetical protein
MFNGSPCFLVSDVCGEFARFGDLLYRGSRGAEVGTDGVEHALDV